jgi:hypothetical protein
LSVSLCALAAAGLALAIPAAATASSASERAQQAGNPAFGGRLYSVAAISADDVWAVGLNGCCALAVHWDGSSWSPYDFTSNGYFNGVAGTGADDVWAVGGNGWSGPAVTLAEHWNGTAWTQVATPNPPGGGHLIAVAATSPSNAWAVGLAGPGPGVPSASNPLIEHWNGKTWTIQKYQVPAAGGGFGSVAATSPSNAWAVGSTGLNSEGSAQQTLIEHWNGSTWTRVPSPDEGTASLLDSVTAVSADNAWAVGYYVAANGTYRTLSMFWNGSKWTLVPSPTPGGDGQLLGVTFSWTNNIWAAGIVNPTRCGHGPACQTLVEHWNSITGKWSVIPSPNPPADYLDMLWGISAVSRSDIWAAGTTDYGSTLIIHWDGRAWS